MKTLYLLRHAKSDWGDEGLADHERPLAPRGLRACKTIGALLAQLTPPEIAWCSSATRTRETFAHTREHWQHPPAFEVTSDLYHAGTREILQVLQRTDPAIECALVIGHNPGLQQLAVALTKSGTGDAWERAYSGFPTCALAVVALPTPTWELDFESGTLSRFVTPRDLR